MQVQLIDPKDKEESLDDGEEEIPSEPCPVCSGDGQVLAQDDLDDEEDRDFKQCPHCGGSGVEVILNEDGEEEDYSFLDED